LTYYHPVTRPSGRVSQSRSTAKKAKSMTEVQQRPFTTAEYPRLPLAGGSNGLEELSKLLETVLTALADGSNDRGGPILPGDPHELSREVRASLGVALPEQGAGPGVLGPMARTFSGGTANLADPAWAAHLTCPPLALAVAADFTATALNADMSSWDQTPAGIVLEGEIMAAFAELIGFDPGEAAGVITSGGTESNFMGLLLAREAAVQHYPGVSGGLASSGSGLRIFASRLAHFSIQRNAALLGFGRNAVVPVDVDARFRMDPGKLGEAMEQARAAGEAPTLVVATVGTTDFGSIDRLADILPVARAHGATVHVDAAYGGGALFSDRLSSMLQQIELADSVSLDLHKFGWQPAGAGVFLARRSTAFDPLAVHASYLNPEDDEEVGYASVLGRSLLTSRRADVFKVAVTLRALGRHGLGAMVETCCDLATYAANLVRGEPRLELVADPALSTVVFRYCTADPDPRISDHIHVALRRRLLREGTAVIGRADLTGAPGGIRLKFTILNPWTTAADVCALVQAVLAAGAAEEQVHSSKEKVLMNLSTQANQIRSREPVSIAGPASAPTPGQVATVLQECEEAVTACASVVFDQPHPLQAIGEVCRDMDCADVLAVTRRMLTRHRSSGTPDRRLLRSQLQVCLVALEMSHEFCSTHAEEYPTARTCSSMTIRGIDACRRLIASLDV
jgi:L-2,4-diaminobutyrate decarboxylase